MTELTRTIAATDSEELTSEDAAKLLHVSRTHLNTLINTGQLASVGRTAGGHRSLSKSEVLNYASACKDRQAKGLSAMVKASERAGLYDLERAAESMRDKR